MSPSNAHQRMLSTLSEILEELLSEPDGVSDASSSSSPLPRQTTGENRSSCPRQHNVRPACRAAPPAAPCAPRDPLFPPQPEVPAGTCRFVGSGAGHVVNGLAIVNPFPACRGPWAGAARSGQISRNRRRREKRAAKKAADQEDLVAVTRAFWKADAKREREGEKKEQEEGRKVRREGERVLVIALAAAIEAVGQEMIALRAEERKLKRADDTE